MSVEANALSTTVDHIAAVAINATVQTTLHDYFTSWLFFFSVISHVKIVILTHIVERRWLKVKYIVNLWIKDTSIQGTKCRVPLCPLKRGSTVYIYTREMHQPTRLSGASLCGSDLTFSCYTPWYTLWDQAFSFSPHTASVITGFFLLMFSAFWSTTFSPVLSSAGRRYWSMFSSPLLSPQRNKLSLSLRRRRLSWQACYSG